METLGKANCGLKSVPPSLLHHHRASISIPISSLSFRTPRGPKSSLSLLSSLKSSSSTLAPPIKCTSNSNPKPSEPHFFETLNPFLKPALIATVTATALFFARLNLKPLIASPQPPTVATETTGATEDGAVDEEKERNLEAHLSSNPDDIEALRKLMELRIKNKKLNEAIQTIDELIRLEPNEVEWPLLKAHMYSYNGDLDLAKSGFNEILVRDPLRVEAYHGLVMAASQAESTDELKEVEKKIQEGMETCKGQVKKEELRDFQLLLAQVRVIEGDYSEALKIYEALVKEEPRDFRPYLCQGIIYTLLRKKDVAEKYFQKYRRLVPKGHPYAQYFDDNMMATKLFSQKM